MHAMYVHLCFFFLTYCFMPSQVSAAGCLVFSDNKRRLHSWAYEDKNNPATPSSCCSQLSLFLSLSAGLKIMKDFKWRKTKLPFFAAADVHCQEDCTQEGHLFYTHARRGRKAEKTSALSSDGGLKTSFLSRYLVFFSEKRTELGTRASKKQQKMSRECWDRTVGRWKSLRWIDLEWI